MRLIIAGSRSITDPKAVSRALEFSPFGRGVTRVISGGARGIDRSGEDWAHKHNIPVTIFRPDWNQHGRSAGMIRNKLMAENADGLLAIWDGKSSGTKNMIETAKRLNLGVYVVHYPGDGA